LLLPRVRTGTSKEDSPNKDIRIKRMGYCSSSGIRSDCRILQPRAASQNGMKVILNPAPAQWPGKPPDHIWLATPNEVVSRRTYGSNIIDLSTRKGCVNAYWIRV